ncbi:hypothetical protein [Bacillus pinisoli]|uniref:hypothetical protein n=1 Tax=Bacillus pinisoli TaxID=2901866 RepID=UPI001FF4FD4B|nr:hypothetical protein [Bacillus pinisoli]
MKLKILLWLSLVGGLLWGLKPIYDLLILDRRIYTGYPPSDHTDYVKFLLPLLCIAGLLMLAYKFHRPLTFSLTILTLALVSSSIFYYMETYQQFSDIPYMILFSLPGMILFFTGAFSLMVQIRRVADAQKTLFYLAITLTVLTVLYCILLPVGIFTLTEETLTVLMAITNMLIGFTFGSFSVPFLITRKTKLNISTELTT